MMFYKQITPFLIVQFIAVPIFFCTGLRLQAQNIVADTSKSSKAPSIDKAANGVPVVNIIKPNASGVSHNRYTKFNVPSNGLILNNFNGQYQQSVLGGYLLSNPNLRGQNTASIILNEVTGNTETSILGAMEVYGDRAAVIVANPNGITIDGANFINVDRVTYTTGTPTVQGGDISLRVTEGKITVNGRGVDATGLDSFDIISRAAEISAEIHAQEINVIAGRNKVNYDDLSVETLADRDGKPEVAIDSSALGGMYANKIKLLSTEKGVGVNTQGVLHSSADDLFMQAAGKVKIKNASAKKNIIVKANEVEVTDNVFTEKNVIIEAEEDVKLNVVQTKGDVSITADSLLVEDQILAEGDVMLNAVKIAALENLYSLGTVEVKAEHVQVNNQLYSENSVIIEATESASLNYLESLNAIKILSGGNITLDIAHSKKDVSLSTNVLVITDQISTEGALTITAQKNADVSNLYSTGTLTVDAGNIDVTGQLYSESSINIESAGSANLNYIESLDSVAIHAQSNASLGSIFSTGNMEIKSAKLYVAELLYSKDSVSIKASEEVSAPVIEADGEISIESYELSIADSLYSSKAFTAIVEGDTTIQDLSTGGNISIKTGSLSISDKILSGGSINVDSESSTVIKEAQATNDITITTKSLSTQNLFANGAVSVNSIANSDVGFIQSIGNLHINSNNLTIDELLSEGDIILNSAGSVNANYISGVGDVSINANSLNISGLLLSEASVKAITSGNTALFNTKATGSIEIKAGSLDSTAEMLSSNTIDIKTTGYTNVLELLAGNDLIVEASKFSALDTSTQKSELFAEHNIKLTTTFAANLENASAQNNATFNTGSITVNDTVFANNNIKIDSSANVNIQNLLAYGNIDLIANNNINIYEQLIAEGDTGITAGNNTKLLSASSQGDLNISAKDISVDKSLIANESLTLTAEKNIIVDSLDAGTNIEATAANIDIEDTAFSAGDLVLNTTGDMNISTGLAQNNLTVSAANISVSKSLLAQGNIKLTASAAIVLPEAKAGNNLTILTSDALSSQHLLAENNMILNASGAILTDLTEAKGNITLSADSLITSGKTEAVGNITADLNGSAEVGIIESGGSITITANKLTALASLKAASNIDLAATTTMNLKKTEAANNIILKAANLNAQNSVFAENNISVTTSGSIDYQSFLANNNITLNVPTLKIDKEIYAINNLTINTDGDIIVNPSMAVLAEGSLSLSTKAGNVTLEQGSLLVAGDSLNLNIKGDYISNEGSTFSQNDTNFYVTGAVNNYEGNILSGRNIVIQKNAAGLKATSFLNSSGTVEAWGGDIIIKANTIENKRRVFEIERGYTSVDIEDSYDAHFLQEMYALYVSKQESLDNIALPFDDWEVYVKNNFSSLEYYYSNRIVDSYSDPTFEEVHSEAESSFLGYIAAQQSETGEYLTYTNRNLFEKTELSDGREGTWILLNRWIGYNKTNDNDAYREFFNYHRSLSYEERKLSEDVESYTWNDSLIETSDFASIKAQGSILFEANTVKNLYSQIASNADITINAKSVSNIGDALYQTTLTQANATHYSPFYSSGGTTDNYGMSVSTDLKTPNVTYTPIQNFYASIEADGNLTINANELINNELAFENSNTAVIVDAQNTDQYFEGINNNLGEIGVVSASVGNLGQVQDADTLGNIELTALGSAPSVRSVDTVTFNNTTNAVEKDDVYIKYAPNTSPQELLFNSIGSLSNLTSYTNSPDSPYLIETNSALTNLNLWLGGEYFIERSGFQDDSPEALARRLGDAFWETQYISRQIYESTGKRFLGDSVSSDYTQMQHLMDNGLAAQKSLNLTPGIALTKEQFNALEEDIFWYVEANIDGETVLVPQLYLSQKTALAALNGSSATISGQNVSMNLSADFQNSGHISATESLTIIAQNILNERQGLLEAQQNLYLQAEQDIQNLSARIKAGNDISIYAGRNFSNESLKTTDSYSGNDPTTIASLSSLDDFRERVAYTGNITAGGNLSISALNNLENRASTLEAAGDISLLAGNNLRFSTLSLNSRESANIASNSFSLDSVHERTTEVGSTLNAGGNVVLSAGNDLSARAADISAGASVALYAGRDIVIENGFTSENYADSNSISSGGFGGGSSSSSNKGNSSEVLASRISAIENLVIQSGNDTTLTAAKINAGNAVDIAAVGDLTLNTAQNQSYAESKSKSKGFLSKKSEHSINESSYATITEVVANGESGGSLSLYSDNNLTLEAAALASQNDINLYAKKNIKILTAAENESSFSEKKSSGLSFHGGSSSSGVTYEKTKETSTSEGSYNRVAQLNALGNLNIESGNNATIDSAILHGTKGINVKTGGDLVFEASYDTKSHTYESESQSIGLTVNYSSGLVNQLISSVELLSDGGGEAGGKGMLAGAMQADKVGSAVYGALKSPGSMLSAMNIDLKASIGINASKTTSEDHSQTGKVAKLTSDGQISLISGNDIVFNGTEIIANENIIIDAAGDITYNQVIDHQWGESESKSGGLNVGVGYTVGAQGAGAGVTVGGSYSQSDSEYDNGQVVNTLFESANGKVNITAGGSIIDNQNKVDWNHQDSNSFGTGDLSFALSDFGKKNSDVTSHTTGAAAGGFGVLGDKLGLNKLGNTISGMGGDLFPDSKFLGDVVNSFGESAFSQIQNGLLTGDELSLDGIGRNALMSGLQAGAANAVAHGPLDRIWSENKVAEYILKPSLHGATQGAVAEVFGYEFKEAFGAAAVGSIAGTAVRDIGVTQGNRMYQIDHVASQLAPTMSQLYAGLSGADPNFGRQIGENVWEFNHNKATTLQAIKDINNSLTKLSADLITLTDIPNQKLDEARLKAAMVTVEGRLDDYFKSINYANKMQVSWVDSRWAVTNALDDSDNDAYDEIASFSQALVGGGQIFTASEEQYAELGDLSAKRRKQIASQVTTLNNIHTGLVVTENTASVLSLATGGGVAGLAAKELIKKVGVKSAIKIISKNALKAGFKAGTSHVANTALASSLSALGMSDEDIRLVSAGFEIYGALVSLKAVGKLRKVVNQEEIVNPNVRKPDAPNNVGKVDFYVPPGKPAVPATGYRAIGGNTQIDEALAGTISPRPYPGTYLTFDDITKMNADEVKNLLQLPRTPSHVVKFDTLQIADDITVPREYWGEGLFLEPFTVSFSKWGTGGGSQVVTELPIIVNPKNVTPLR